jgi:hypothetical protein
MKLMSKKRQEDLTVHAKQLRDDGHGEGAMLLELLSEVRRCHRALMLSTPVAESPLPSVRSDIEASKPGSRRGRAV